jgi:hypothetical protein
MPLRPCYGNGTHDPRKDSTPLSFMSNPLRAWVPDRICLSFDEIEVRSKIGINYNNKVVYSEKICLFSE